MSQAVNHMSFAITREQKHSCQYPKCLKVEYCWLTERAFSFSMEGSSIIVVWIICEVVT